MSPLLESLRTVASALAPDAGVTVPAATLLALLDRASRVPDGDQTLSRIEAAVWCGCHRDSLTRMVRMGRLTNVGTKYRPRFRAADLPRKSLHSHASRRGVRLERSNV
jgi:hypothetical protein